MTDAARADESAVKPRTPTKAKARRVAKKHAKKTAAKTAKPSPLNGVALPVGNHPGNTGGKPGRSGRLPDEFRERMRELVSTDDKLAHLEAILNNSTHPHYMAAYKMAAEFGYGKATQAVEMTGKEGGPIEVAEVETDALRKRIASRIAGLGSRIAATEDLGRIVPSGTVGA